jgi:polar amino acid transport system substrate-binding protein
VATFARTVAAALFLAAAGAAAAGAVGTSKITPPANIAKAGKIVFCTDATYPPEESLDTRNRFVGSDIDFATQAAALMGVKAQFKNVTFDGIIAALLAKKCDAIISGMNDTPERRKAVDFVDYLKVGQTLMVKKGNPSHITSLASLSGKTVSVETGTTNRDFLLAESKKLQKAGKKPISIKAFPKDTDAAAALKAGRVDAYFGDAPVVVYYIKQDPTLQVGVSPIAPIPIGIALRKHDPLRPALQKAISALYANGKIKQILAKWGMAGSVGLLK